MSAVHMSYDDYGFPHSGSPQPPSYDISYGLGGVPLHSSSVYPPSHLDASTSAAHPGLLSSQLPPDSAYASYYPTSQDHFAAPAYLSHALLDPHASLYPAAVLRQPSPHPHPMYDAGRPSSSEAAYAPTASEWNGNVPYPAHYDPVGSAAAYVRGLTDIIDSSHTVQSQQANLAPQPPQQQHLSGSLDPTTGEFHRTVEHPRLRTAQACEKCRIRKAKCTGDSPCSRCLSRGLQCEYAPERKMRGPNKNKRGDTSPKSAKAKPRKGKDSPPSELVDLTTDEPASDTSPPPEARGRSSSTHSSPVPPHRLLAPRVPGGRPRAATLGLGAIGRLSHLNDSSDAVSPSSPLGARPRPPPLNLSSEREYVPRMLAQYVGASEPAAVAFPMEDRSARPTSLPSYLIDSYSRIALTNPGEDRSPQSSSFDRPPSQDMSSFLSDSPASAFSHSRTSSSDISAPISPISLSFENELQFPDHIASEFAHFGDGAPEHPFAGDVHMYGASQDDLLLRPKSAQHGWTAALVQGDDRTPQGLSGAHMGDMLMYP